MTIAINPNALGLPWTTLLTLLGVLSALAWMLWQAPSLGLSRSATYAIAMRTTLWAVLGARLLHVVDYADFYRHVPFQAFYLWTGGMSLWGALILGSAGALWHAKRRGASLATFADHLTLVGLVAIAVGRLGDLLAGERLGTSASLPWAVVYTHAGSASFGAGAAHPVALYELLAVAAIGLALVAFRRRLRPGSTIDLAFMAYAVARFAIGFATVNRTYLGLGLSQWIALVLFAVIAWYAWRHRERILTHSPVS